MKFTAAIFATLLSLATAVWQCDQKVFPEGVCVNRGVPGDVQQCSASAKCTRNNNSCEPLGPGKAKCS
ncbi:hypothetical protein SMMN14_04185 [Sphaerulina musiva]